MEPLELHYRDCPTVEVELVISAEPEVVWALVADIQLPARFSSEFDGATGPTLGGRFVGRNHHPAAGDWETTSTIVEYEPDRAFGWAVGDPEEPSSRWRFSLTPHEEGVRLAQWMQMGPARSGINLAIDAMPDKESKILHRRLAEHRTNMEATLQGIKRLAEEGPPTDGGR